MTNTNSETDIDVQENYSWLSKNVLYLLALIVTIGFFSLVAYLAISPVPKDNSDILNVMLGSLGTAWISIITYFFGSSAGSKRSADFIKKIAESK